MTILIPGFIITCIAGGFGIIGYGINMTRLGMNTYYDGIFHVFAGLLFIAIGLGAMLTILS